MDASKFAGALERALLCEMPHDLRASIEETLKEHRDNLYILKSAYERISKRLVLAVPREDIDWNPTVDADACIGCGACYDFCPHSVYELREEKATVAAPTECVVLCSNCVPLCPVSAISFPNKEDYVRYLRYA